MTVGATGITATQSGINVAPAAPISLTAKAASASQINLTWGAAAGATGYLIQSSANGGSTWTQVASVTGGTTSYHDTGLAAGTTYEFRVYATGGGLQSAASSVASATTTGTRGGVRLDLEQLLHSIRERLQLGIVRAGREVHLQRGRRGDRGPLLQADLDGRVYPRR